MVPSTRVLFEVSGTTGTPDQHVTSLFFYAATLRCTRLCDHALEDSSLTHSFPRVPSCKSAIPKKFTSTCTLSLFHQRTEQRHGVERHCQSTPTRNTQPPSGSKQDGSTEETTQSFVSVRMCGHAKKQFCAFGASANESRQRTRWSSVSILAKRSLHGWTSRYQTVLFFCAGLRAP